MLKTVDEHNAERRAFREYCKKAAKRTGVACSKCGEELEWTGIVEAWTVGAYPPITTADAFCPKCSLRIELET